VRGTHTREEKEIDDGRRECKNPYTVEACGMAKRGKSLLKAIMESVKKQEEEKKRQRIERAAARGRRVDSMSALLRAALKAQPSLNAVEKATGVKRQSLSLFVQGEQASLRLPAIEKLAEYFGIECSMPAAVAIKKEQKNG
jgi:aminopeptidase N